MKVQIGRRGITLPFLSPRPLYSRERTPVPILQEAGWVSGPIWTGAENSLWISNPNRPAHSDAIPITLPLSTKLYDCFSKFKQDFRRVKKNFYYTSQKYFIIESFLQWCRPILASVRCSANEICADSDRHTSMKQIQNIVFKNK